MLGNEVPLWRSLVTIFPLLVEQPRHVSELLVLLFVVRAWIGGPH